MTAAGAAEPKAGATAFLTGHAHYIDDIAPDGLLYMAVARSPHAHARLTGIDLAPARSMPGVVLALSGADVQAQLAPIPYVLDPELIGGRRATVRALAAERVRYVGEPVAVVAAEDRYTARAAARSIKAAFEPLPAVVTGAAAVAPDAPLLHEADGWPDNILAAHRFAAGDAEGALAAAPHRVRHRFSIQRYTTAPIEPRGYVASWDEASGSLTVHASHQHPFQLRWSLSQTLGLPESAIRVIVPHVGGTFGMKMTGYPEEPLVCLLSRLSRRPVKWIESRAECFLGGGREQVHEVEAGFGPDGELLALRDDILIPVGAAAPSPGWRMSYVSAAAMPTAYRVPHVDIRLRVAATNAPPWHSCRGYGKEAPVAVMERLMDVIADELGLDPAAVRHRNLLTPAELPHRMPAGYAIDSGDYPTVLDSLLHQADYQGLRRRQATCPPDADWRPGIGIAFEVTPEGGGHAAGKLSEAPAGPPRDAETATVRLTPSGTVDLLTGTTTPGGGSDTVLAGLVAAELGIAREEVRVIQGDTLLCPPGGGNSSSRGASIGGAAAVLAAQQVARSLRQAAAGPLGVPAAAVKLSDRAAREAGGGSITLAELCGLVRAGAAVVPPGALEATRSYRAEQSKVPGETEAYRQSYPYFSNGAYLACVEVDCTTGVVRVTRLVAIHDCGHILNQTLVEGQLHGAMAMGLGAALTEHSVIDAAGQVTADSFKTYLLPRADDVPAFELWHHEVPSPNTLLGTKGAGEAGLGGALAAIANAVYDAIGRPRTHATTFPLSPPEVLRLMNAGPGR